MNESAVTRRSRALKRFAVLLLIVFGSFFAFSAVRSPVPGINEPHYLCKAKHFWEPNWCAGDFFLDSSNPHLCFYWTIGWLTHVLPLSWAAWVGRLLGLSVLASGWVFFLQTLHSERRLVVWTSWTYLLMAACGNFSGEWLVGGIEAKVIAYGLAFWALGFWLRKAPRVAALCAGLALSFHQVVGAWFVICGTLVVGLEVWVRRLPGSLNQPTEPTTEATKKQTLPELPAGHLKSDRLLFQRLARFGVDSWKTAGQLVVLFLLGALPGLVVGFRLLLQGDPQLQFTANYIQVFYRLRHHLDPNRFKISSYIGYGVLLVCWGAAVGGAVLFQPKTHSQRKRLFPFLKFSTHVRRWEQMWFYWLVVASFLVVLVGLAVGLGPPPTARTTWQAVRMSVLKLYPFRLFDALLPLAAACVLSEAVASWLCRPSNSPPGQETQKRLRTWNVVAWTTFAGFYVVSLLLPAPDKNPSRMPPSELNAWLAACRWVKEHAPSRALVLTPTHSWAFKWYAQRAEYVCFKDCPQDPKGIVEWNQRLLFLRKWAQEHYADQLYSKEEVRELCRRTGVNFILVKRLGPFALQPVYRNEFFRIYDVSDLTDSPSP